MLSPANIFLRTLMAIVLVLQLSSINSLKSHFQLSKLDDGIQYKGTAALLNDTGNVFEEENTEKEDIFDPAAIMMIFLQVLFVFATKLFFHQTPILKFRRKYLYSDIPPPFGLN